MIVNWKVIAALLGIAIFYEVLVVFLWFGLKWMITPFIKPGLKLFIAIIFFFLANFSIIAYILRLGAPWVNYGNIWFFYFVNGAVIAIILLITKLILKLFKLNLSYKYVCFRSILGVFTYY